MRITRYGIVLVILSFCCALTVGAQSDDLIGINTRTVLLVDDSCSMFPLQNLDDDCVGNDADDIRTDAVRNFIQYLRLLSLTNNSHHEIAIYLFGSESLSHFLYPNENSNNSPFVDVSDDAAVSSLFVQLESQRPHLFYTDTANAFEQARLALDSVGSDDKLPIVAIFTDGIPRIDEGSPSASYLEEVVAEAATISALPGNWKDCSGTDQNPIILSMLFGDAFQSSNGIERIWEDIRSVSGSPAPIRIDGSFSAQQRIEVLSSAFPELENIIDCGSNALPMPPVSVPVTHTTNFRVSNLYDSIIFRILKSSSDIEVNIYRPQDSIEQTNPINRYNIESFPGAALEVDDYDDSYEIFSFIRPDDGGEGVAPNWRGDWLIEVRNVGDTIPQVSFDFRVFADAHIALQNPIINNQHPLNTPLYIETRLVGNDGDLLDGIAVQQMEYVLYRENPDGTLGEGISIQGEIVDLYDWRSEFGGGNFSIPGTYVLEIRATIGLEDDPAVIIDTIRFVSEETTAAFYVNADTLNCSPSIQDLVIPVTLSDNRFFVRGYISEAENPAQIQEVIFEQVESSTTYIANISCASLPANRRSNLVVDLLDPSTGNIVNSQRLLINTDIPSGVVQTETFETTATQAAILETQVALGTQGVEIQLSQTALAITATAEAQIRASQTALASTVTAEAQIQASQNALAVTATAEAQMQASQTALAATETEGAKDSYLTATAQYFANETATPLANLIATCLPNERVNQSLSACEACPDQLVPTSDSLGCRTPPLNPLPIIIFSLVGLGIGGGVWAWIVYSQSLPKMNWMLENKGNSDATSLFGHKQTHKLHDQDGNEAELSLKQIDATTTEVRLLSTTSPSKLEFNGMELSKESPQTMKAGEKAKLVFGRDEYSFTTPSE